MYLVAKTRMNEQEAFQLFERMIKVAEEQLVSFTKNSNINVEKKADKSVVTECDQTIDRALTNIAHEQGLKVVSEEGEHVLDIVKSGSYMTIDPIDGTLGYIEYVNDALDNDGIHSFGTKDLGAASDFCLLLGIVENNSPKFGILYNYITKEKIFVSAEGKLIRENNVRNYDAKHCFYMDQRMGGELEAQVHDMEGVTSVVQAAFGLKSMYTIINPHKNAVTIHRVQSAGLWDVMPAAVAAKAFGAKIFDDLGQELEFDKYIVLPGKGASVIKGKLFDFVPQKLKEIPN